MNKRRAIAAVLCFCFGRIGAHYFYAKRIKMAILYILTSGLFGIGLLIDFIRIIVGLFPDDTGEKI